MRMRIRIMRTQTRRHHLRTPVARVWVASVAAVTAIAGTGSTYQVGSGIALVELGNLGLSCSADGSVHRIRSPLVCITARQLAWAITSEYYWRIIGEQLPMSTRPLRALALTGGDDDDDDVVCCCCCCCSFSPNRCCAGVEPLLCLSPAVAVALAVSAKISDVHNVTVFPYIRSLSLHRSAGLWDF